MKLIASDGAIYQCNEEPSSTITLAPVKHEVLDDLDGSHYSFSPRDPLVCVNGNLELRIINIATGGVVSKRVDNARYNETFFSNSKDMNTVFFFVRGHDEMAI